MRLLIAVGVSAVAAACSGCDAKTQKALTQEVLRVTYVEGHGPVVLASIVGASAPPGGPAALNGLCTDQMWRLLVGKQLPEFESVPSLFEVPDPHRPFQITTTSHTRQAVRDGE